MLPEDMPFTQFVLTNRLKRVRQKLTNPSLAAVPISAIAFATGFGDLSYFNRVFRRQFGATPSEIRSSAAGGKSETDES